MTPPGAGQLQCPNGCGPLQPFKQPDSHGWECPKCGYFYNTRNDPTETTKQSDL